MIIFINRNLVQKRFSVEKNYKSNKYVMGCCLSTPIRLWIEETFIQNTPKINKRSVKVVDENTPLNTYNKPRQQREWIPLQNNTFTIQKDYYNDWEIV